MRRFLFIIFVAFVFLCFGQEQMPPGMKQYTLVLLRRAPNLQKLDAADAAELQKQHLANIRKMFDAGKLLVAGPVGDDGELRGIFIFQNCTETEIREMVKPDPLISRGRMLMELHPWYASENLKVDPHR